MNRQDQADGDQDLYAQQVPMRPITREVRRMKQKARQSCPTPCWSSAISTNRKFSNYAIVGQTLWNFSPQRTQKIPLSDLDLPATTKANEERGVTFRVPAAGEGQ